MATLDKAHVSPNGVTLAYTGIKFQAVNVAGIFGKLTINYVPFHAVE
jgi:hypothetical protein